MAFESVSIMELSNFVIKKFCSLKRFFFFLDRFVFQQKYLFNLWLFRFPIHPTALAEEINTKLVSSDLNQILYPFLSGGVCGYE